MAAARAAEGLDDFGAPPFAPALEQLCRAIEAEAALSALGRRVTWDRMVGVLRNRLRAQALRARHVEITRTEIEAPVIITGLQRTGTTLLHRLLSADPRFRALRSWEALNPAPFQNAATGRRDPRRAHARRAERGLGWLAPDFFAVHPVQAEGIEEEVILLDHSFYSTVPEATLRVPTFSRWLEQQDQAVAYITLRRMLELLSWQAGPTRWVLKTPHHLEWLDALFEEFPDARVIHTHRDPVTTVPSFCSMIAHGRGVMSDAVDPVAIGEEWLRKVARMMDRALDVRADREDRGFVDVQYADLMEDPMAEVARIYDALDISLTPEARHAIDAQRRASPQHAYGRHVYDAADFALTEERIAARFARYRDRFGFG
jgi:hypothetical protein